MTSEAKAACERVYESLGCISQERNLDRMDAGEGKERDEKKFHERGAHRQLCTSNHTMVR